MPAPIAGLPGGTVSYEHLAAQTRARQTQPPPKCKHGYWIHAHGACPWCWGVHAGRNDDVVPHKGEGNGWMLRDGDPACLECGGPANAGYGLVPPGMTSAQLEAERMRPKKCYGCTVDAGFFNLNGASVVKTTSSRPVETDAPASFNPGKERF